jgi:tRNA (guanine37-N1)-methyltransferase
MPRLIRRVLAEANLEARGLSVESGIDVIGDVAILRLDQLDGPAKKDLAEALLRLVPNVKGVFEQRGGIEGEYRLRRLNHIAGEDRVVTTHRENGCLFSVDLSKCYFSPRLSTERLRIAESVRPDESVLNMFAGVGPFSIPIAKKRGAKVTSCELNDAACRYHDENDRLNKVEGLVRVVNGDAADLPGVLEERFDRILMPHPTKADQFLDAALALANRGARVHYYRQVLGRNDKEGEASLRGELDRLLPAGSVYQVRRVREVGPRWLEMVADIVLSS